jgi:hypothetical protein
MNRFPVSFHIVDPVESLTAIRTGAQACRVLQHKIRQHKNPLRSLGINKLNQTSMQATTKEYSNENSRKKSEGSYGIQCWILVFHII